jgi:hypothetical protein
MNKNTSFGKIHNFLRSKPPALLQDDCWQDCQRALADESGVFPCQYHSIIVLHAQV